MRRRLPVRTKVAVRLFTLPGSKPDETALDDDKTLALRLVQGPEQVCRRQAADFGRELNVEPVAQDRQKPDQLRRGSDVLVHPHGQ